MVPGMGDLSRKTGEFKDVLLGAENVEAGRLKHDGRVNWKRLSHCTRNRRNQMVQCERCKVKNTQRAVIMWDVACRSHGKLNF